MTKNLILCSAFVAILFAGLNSATAEEKSMVGEATDTVKSAAEAVADKTGEIAKSATETAKEGVASVRGESEEAAKTTEEAAKQASSDTATKADEAKKAANPS